MKLSLHIVGTRDELRNVLESIGKGREDSRVVPVQVLTKDKVRIGVKGKKIFTAEDGFERAHYKWRRNENAYLRKAHTTTPIEVMAKTLGRTVKSVDAQMRIRGLYAKHRMFVMKPTTSTMSYKKRKRKLIKTQNAMRDWAYADDQILRQMYRKVPTRQIADKLGRSRKSVYLRARSIGLSHKLSRSKYETRKAVDVSEGQVQ